MRARAGDARVHAATKLRSDVEARTQRGKGAYNPWSARSATVWISRARAGRADRSSDPAADRPADQSSDHRERGATRTQYLVLVLLVAVAFALTALLLWSRLDGDAGLAVTWLI